MFNPPKLLGEDLTSRNYHGKIKLWEVTEKNCSFLMMAKPVHLRAKRKASTWLLYFEKGPGTSINLWMELILKFEVGESLGAATGEWLCGLHCSLPQHHCLPSSASAPSSTYVCRLNQQSISNHVNRPWVDLSRPPNNLHWSPMTDWLTFLGR